MNKKRSFEQQLVWLSLFPSVPLLIIFLTVMVEAHYSFYWVALAAFVFSLLIAFSTYIVHQKVTFQFNVVSNLLEAIKNRDYSMRARSYGQGQSQSAFNDVAGSLNSLAATLSRQNAQLRENQTLLNHVINHIDVAIISVDEHLSIELMNPAADQLFSLCDQHELVKQVRSILKSLTLNKDVVEMSIGARRGRFRLHGEDFFIQGHSHKLIFIADVSTILSDEARHAWKNLVRVMSHEVNNSLTPISSIAQSLLKRTQQSPADVDLNLLTRGLETISERSCNLAAFLSSYKQLLEIPVPDKQPTYVTNLLEKVCALFDGRVRYPHNKQHLLFIDPVQIEQVLINLIKNALDAMDNQPGLVDITWQAAGGNFKLVISDEGPGIGDTENLFVPFYTTKKGGSGIGLALSQQVIEAHGGRLSLANKPDGAGCQAIIELPL